MQKDALVSHVLLCEQAGPAPASQWPPGSLGMVEVGAFTSPKLNWTSGQIALWLLTSG